MSQLQLSFFQMGRGALILFLYLFFFLIYFNTIQYNTGPNKVHEGCFIIHHLTVPCPKVQPLIEAKAEVLHYRITEGGLHHHQH